MARIDVVILNWNGERHLRTFLPSVLAATAEGVRITVADNGSTDGSVALLKEGFPDVNIIELDNNYGFAEGYNRALADCSFADTEYFVLLNSDVETPLGWIEPLVDYMDAHGDVAAAAPKVLSYSDREYFEYAGASGGFIDELGYPFCRGRIMSNVERDGGQYDQPREVFWATGACMMVRAEVFRSLGGFDGDFFAHMEEIDFCWRAKLSGWKIAVVPASAVYHLGGGTLGADNPRKLYLNYRNNLYMLYKNLPPRVRGRVVTTRMVADGCAASVYLLLLKFNSFRAVWRAHKDFRRHRAVLDARNKQIAPQKTLKELYGVYKGSIILRYIFGKKKFGQML